MIPPTCKPLGLSFGFQALAVLTKDCQIRKFLFREVLKISMSSILNRERTNGNGGSLLSRPFSDLWGLDPFRNFSSAMPGASGVEVTRTEAGYMVEIPVAGFRPQDIEVTLEDGVLSVIGKNEKRSFTRTLTVPEDVDEERIEANVEHGMLTLTLNLLPKAQPKKIAIKSN